MICDQTFNNRFSCQDGLRAHQLTHNHELVLKERGSISGFSYGVTPTISITMWSLVVEPIAPINEPITKMGSTIVCSRFSRDKLFKVMFGA